MTKRLVIIDGKSVFYRGYYAMPGSALKMACQRAAWQVCHNGARGSEATKARLRVRGVG
jgi:hypothetical protein